MKRAKIIFNQTLMISTGILFDLGIQALINYLAGGKAEITWPWYIPLSVILTGFLCALATALLIDREGEGRAFGKLAIVLHFLALFAVVAGFGWLFGWYEDVGGLLVISAMYRRPSTMPSGRSGTRNNPEKPSKSAAWPHESACWSRCSFFCLFSLVWYRRTQGNERSIR